MNKFLYGLISLVFITVAALLVGPGLWDWNGYKPEILERFKAETGRQIEIDGDLSFAVLPSPRFAVDGVRIANVEGATTAEFARFKSLSIRIRMWPLLSGRIEIESVELINPVLEFEILADRRVNWIFGRLTKNNAQNMSKGAPDRSGPTGEPSSEGRSFALDRLVIRGGQLVYRDAAKGTVKKLENLDIEGFAGSLAGPFGMEGALTFRGLRLDASLLMGRLDEGGPVPLNLRLANADAKAIISGGVDSTKSQFLGKVEISGNDIRGFARAMSADNVELPAWLGRKFDLVSRIEASLAGVSIYDIDFRIGDTSIRGGINAVFGERIRIDVALKAQHIDLDKWLSQVLHRTDTGTDGNNGGATVQASKYTAVATSETSDGFVLPTDIDGALKISVEAVAFKGRQMREIALAMVLDDGTIKLNRFSAHLPGGGTVSLTGSLTTTGSQVSYRGDTSIRADNLRSVLDWLDADISHVPADRLHRFQLKAKLNGDQEIVQITDLEMRLDSSRIRGGVTYALRRRPAFGARITIDQFNLDAYLPRPRLVGARTAKADKFGKGPPPRTQPPPAMIRRLRPLC